MNSQPVRIILLLLSIAGLVAVRQWEDELFYDPLIVFFQTDHKVVALPELVMGKLLLYTLLRFAINSIFTLVVLWAVFLRADIVKFAGVLLGIGALMLLPAMAVLIQFSDSGEYMGLFYVRRFLIQPIGLFVLLPAFYFYGRR